MEFETDSNPGRIWLDGTALSVPEEFRGSLADLLAHIEQLALQGERVLSSLSIDGRPIHHSASPQQWTEISATSITFAELSGRLVGAATANLKLLQAEVEEAILRVVINEPQCIDVYWNRWHPDIHNTLAVFSLLRQLWRTDRFNAWIHPAEVQRLGESIDQIICDIRVLLLRPAEDEHETSLALSNLLEQALLPWFEETHRLLDQLQDHISDE